MEWEGSLIPLFWLFILIFLIQAILTKFKWLKIPTILAYILLGMIISSSHIGGFKPEQINWLNGLSQLGLFYLMFLSGMEIDLQLLRFGRGSRNLKSNPLILGILIFMGCLVLSFLLGLRIHKIDPTIKTWMVMLILLTTSLGIVMPTLKETGLIKSNYGQILLTSAIIADLITMLILSTVAGTYHSGFTIRQASIGLLLPLLIFCYQFITKLRNTELWKTDIQNNSVVKFQGVLAVLGLYGVLTDFARAEPILGSFLAGLLLSAFRLSENNQLKKQLEVIGNGLIIPIFFVMVGFNFKLSEFLNSPKALAWVPLLITTAYVVKILPMAFLIPHFGLRRSIAGGFLLSSRMTLIVVAASIGLKLGLIPVEIQDAVLVVAIITCFLSPMIFLFSFKEV